MPKANLASKGITYHPVQGPSPSHVSVSQVRFCTGASSVVVNCTFRDIFATGTLILQELCDIDSHFRVWP